MAAAAAAEQNTSQTGSGRENSHEVAPVPWRLAMFKKPSQQHSFGSPGCVIVFKLFLLERLEPVSLCDECVCYLFSASVAQANARRCVRPLLDNVDIKAKAYMCVHV